MQGLDYFIKPTKNRHSHLEHDKHGKNAVNPNPTRGVSNVVAVMKNLATGKPVYASDDAKARIQNVGDVFKAIGTNKSVYAGKTEIKRPLTTMAIGGAATMGAGMAKPKPIPITAKAGTAISGTIGFREGASIAKRTTPTSSSKLVPTTPNKSLQDAIKKATMPPKVRVPTPVPIPLPNVRQGPKPNPRPLPPNPWGREPRPLPPFERPGMPSRPVPPFERPRMPSRPMPPNELGGSLGRTMREMTQIPPEARLTPTRTPTPNRTVKTASNTIPDSLLR
jgi:hypothetical protein